jgi:hypothetical protein
MRKFCFTERPLQFFEIAHKSLGNSICPSSLLSLIQVPFLFSPYRQRLSLSLFCLSSWRPSSFPHRQQQLQPEQALGGGAARWASSLRPGESGSWAARPKAA